MNLFADNVIFGPQTILTYNYRLSTRGLGNMHEEIGVDYFIIQLFEHSRKIKVYMDTTIHRKLTDLGVTFFVLMSSSSKRYL